MPFNEALASASLKTAHVNRFARGSRPHHRPARRHNGHGSRMLERIDQRLPLVIWRLRAQDQGDQPGSLPWIPAGGWAIGGERVQCSSMDSGFLATLTGKDAGHPAALRGLFRQPDEARLEPPDPVEMVLFSDCSRATEGASRRWINALQGGAADRFSSGGQPPRPPLGCFLYAYSKPSDEIMRESRKLSPQPCGRRREDSVTGSRAPAVSTVKESMTT